MKKAISLILVIMMIFTLSACTGNVNNGENTTNVYETQSNNSDTGKSIENKLNSKNSEDTGKVLIAYFSYTGNTETIANYIEQETGGKLFKIKTVKSYSDDYDKRTEEAKEEQNNNARPGLSTHVDNMDKYDVVFLGYPIWWGTMPMAMFTFLEEYNFSGKTIIPFCTHEGSALGRSEDDIASLCPDSTMLDGLAIRGSSVDGAENEVKEWIKGLNVSE